jgi:tetratricopeptide (TPR) repeat protein
MNTHFLRGRLLIDQCRFDLAIEELRKATALDQDDASNHALLGLALLRTGRAQEAVKSAELALEKDPNDDYAHWMMALIRLERNELKAAEISIRQAIELDSHSAPNRGLLARILCEGNRFAEALKVADEGLSIDPTNDLCLTFRARALMGLGRKAEAGQVAHKLLEEDPEDGWNHCLRGDQLLVQGDSAGARVHFLEALRLDPRNEYARYGLATSLKARSLIYGVLLKALLSLGKFRTWALWGAMIVLFLGLRFGDRFVNQHPEWMVPYEGAKALLWGALIIIMIANPIFDLMLRFDSEGRHALSADELRATNWYLPCLGFGALCLVWMCLSKGGVMPRGLGMASFFLCFAVSQVFEATPGYVRTRMAILTSLAGACLVVTTLLLVSGVFLLFIKLGLLGGRLLIALIWVPAIVMLYTAFSDDLRNWLEKRRPDEH